MGKQILFVAPYTDLYQRVVGLVEAHGYPVEVIRGNMETVDQVAREIAARGPEVVISRGGTYRLLSERLDIPLVETKISAYDILDACAGIGHVEGPIGFLGFGNVIYGMDILERVLDKKVHIINLASDASPETVEQHVRRLAERGVRYFVGDTIGARMAAQMGYTSRTVQTDDKTIMMSIDEAMHLLDVKLKERMAAQRYRVIIDATDSAMISRDKLSATPLLNKAAEVFCRSQDISPQALMEVLALEEDSAADGTEIIRVNDQCTVTVNKSPIVIDGAPYGVVATFQNISQIQKMEQKIRTELSAKGLRAKYTFDDIIYECPMMEKVVSTARKFAASEATVLIQAQTGTGKELFAQSIHNASPRADQPFVAINCAALPENLLESELFGYVGGAFTGAKRGGRTGLFELAHGGTIFLDEIGDMPLNLQARLLRVIQEKEVMRIGAEKIIPVDVRIIASTNANLLESVRAGGFREDLYYRLNILSLRIPPLGERQGDIILLSRKLMQEVAAKSGKTLSGFDSDAMQALLDHEYHGNIRELRGIIERAVVIADTPYITKDSLGIEERGPRPPVTGRLQEIERSVMEQTLAQWGGNYTKAARALGIDRSTLYRRMKHEKGEGR